MVTGRILFILFNSSLIQIKINIKDRGNLNFIVALKSDKEIKFNIHFDETLLKNANY